MTSPGLFVLAGPTAVGKGTVISYIRRHFPQMWLSVSMTTRNPRPGEKEGEHYFFVDHEHFAHLVDTGEMLEYAVVHGGHMYGTPRQPVQTVLDTGRPVLLEIDVQGARQVRASFPGAHLIFLQPPNWEELKKRLIGRGTETPSQQEARLDTARKELAASAEFDTVITNDEISRAAEEIISLMRLPTDS